MSQPLNNIDELRDLNLSDGANRERIVVREDDKGLLDSHDRKGHEEGYEEGTQDETPQEDTQENTQQDTQPDRQPEHQQNTQEDTKQARQKDHEERRQEPDQGSNDHNDSHNQRDHAQVTANTKGSIDMTTQDPTSDSSEPQQQTTAGCSSLGTPYHNAARDQLVLALRRPTPDAFQSPLLALQHQVKNCFLPGGRPSSREEWMNNLGSSLFLAACNSSTKVPRPPHDKLKDAPTSWSEMTTATVGVFACPADGLFKAIALQRLVSPKDIAKKPSESLYTAYLEARAAARGDRASSSLIVAVLVDVHMQDMLKQGKKRDYTSFSHSLAMGVGPEGVAIWQSWDSAAGYGLGDWISKGGANIRKWDEATEFAHCFEDFVDYKVSGLRVLLISSKEVSLIPIAGEMGR